jgi:hypothetical protein
MRLGLGLLSAVVFLAIAASTPAFAQFAKPAKSGESIVIYQHRLVGGVPAGIKPPSPYIEQPAHGVVTAKIIVEGAGSTKSQVFRFFYTSNKGYKGSDSAVVGVNMQMRTRDGKIHSIVFPEPIKIFIRVN